MLTPKHLTDFHLRCREASITLLICTATDEENTVNVVLTISELKLTLNPQQSTDSS